MIFHSIGIFYLELQYLLNDNDGRITPSPAVEDQAHVSQGQASPAFLYRQVCRVDEAKKWAQRSMDALQKRVPHMVYEEAV